MLPTVDPVYSVAKGVFLPWLRWGLRWTIEGADNIPTAGPVVLASNHVSYLDPLTLAWVADRRGRHVRFLAKAELFDKPVLGSLLRAAHQIPVRRGRAESAGALDGGRRAWPRRVRRRVPRRHDLRGPRADGGKSGTARLARRAGVAITPVGLWGTHRILTKGRKPHWQWRIEQTAVVGDADRGRARRAREGDDRSNDGRDRRVRRPRPRAVPRHPPGEVPGGGAIPAPRARTGGPRDASRGGRRRVVGNRGRRDRRPERADHVVGAARELAASIDSDHENPDYLPGIALPAELRATADLAEACAGADVVVFAVPSHGLRAVLAEARPHVRSGARS